MQHETSGPTTSSPPPGSPVPEAFDGVSEAAIESMAAAIRRGGVALAPADTVYGFFGNGLDPRSVTRVYDIKQRDRSKPFVIYSNRELADQWGVMNEAAERLIDAFWPKALAVIVPVSPRLPREFTGGRDNVAIMTASNPLTAGVVAALPELPVFGTSVNVSGEPEMKTAVEVTHFAGAVDVFVADDSIPIWGRVSTIVDCSNTAGPRIIRLSAVSAEEVREVLPDVRDA